MLLLVSRTLSHAWLFRLPNEEECAHMEMNTFMKRKKNVMLNHGTAALTVAK